MAFMSNVKRIIGPVYATDSPVRLDLITRWIAAPDALPATVTGEGWGGIDQPATAGQADPDVQAPDRPPGPPNRGGLDMPSADVATLPKNFQQNPQRTIPTTTQSCANCYSSRPTATTRLSCHSHAPRPNSTTAQVQWPEVAPNDWCAEWLDLREASAWHEDYP